MRASTIIAFGAAGLAAAAPTSAPSCGNNTDNGDVGDRGKFFVNKFVFGCTVTCDYSFNLNFQNDPVQYECKGSLTDKDYVECKGDEANQSYYAYIDTTTDANLLKLQYEVSNPDEGTRTNYYGEEQVYAATSEDADKQEDNFSVGVSSVTAVA